MGMGKEIIQLQTEKQIYNALIEFSMYMFTPLEVRGFTYTEYAKKLCQYAEVYLARECDKEIGIIAFYCNDFKNYIGFLSNIIVRDSSRRSGTGAFLLELFLKRCHECRMHTAMLEVHENNYVARSFYEKHGFKTIDKADGFSVYMEKELINVL